MAASFFSHLECSVPCGAGPYDARHEHHLCACGAPLLARYDLTAAKRWPPTTLAGRESTMWRYREILPLLESDKGVDAPVTLGEGWTPLVRARRLGRSLALDRLYVKDESINPTGSFKAREASASATRAVHLGVRVVTIEAPGHAAAAVAAYAAHAGLEAHLFLPSDTRPIFARECEAFGAAIESGDRAAHDQAHHWYDMASLTEPYAIEGAKTIGYEIAEQLGWKVPDWIVMPTGGGAGLVGIWKAFAEMASLGWIDPVRRPHVVAVQAAGCAPLVRALGTGADKAVAWESPRTIADGLRVPQSLGDSLALRAIRESNGTAMGVGDAEMIGGMRELAQIEGISAAPESGGALHALRVLTNEGRVKTHDTVVVVNTGGGLRYLDLFDQKA